MARGYRHGGAGNATKPYEIEILQADTTYSRCVNPAVTDGVLTASIGGSHWGVGNHLIIQFSVSDESVLSIASGLSLSGAKYYIVDSNNTVLYNSAAAGTIILPADIITFYIYCPSGNVNDLGQHAITVQKK